MKKLVLLGAVFLTGQFLSAQEETFEPQVQYGIGMIGQTSIQQTGDDQGYYMDRAGLKKGFIHTNVKVTPKLSGKLQLGYHSPNAKVFEFYVDYKFNDLIAIRGGRFKTGGPRAHFEEAIYDQEFTEIPFTVSEFARDMRIPDFRRYGLQAHGQWKWVNYKVFYHDGDGFLNVVPSTQFVDANQNRASNVGFKLTNFDVFLSLTPIENAEFGGHIGRASFAGMGRESITHHSLFFYYKPNKWQLKLDYLAYPQVVFDDGFVPDSKDFSLHPYNTVDKNGYSVFAGYDFHPKFKAGVRFERFDQGPLGSTPGKEYEQMDIYTAGVTFFPIEGNRRNKIVLFYEHFDERKTAPGFDRPNDIIGLAAQLFILKK